MAVLVNDVGLPSLQCLQLQMTLSLLLMLQRRQQVDLLDILPVTSRAVCFRV